MKIERISKIILGSAFALTLVFTSVVPSIEVKAASSPSMRGEVEIRYINGNGVNFRREGHADGEILGVMYDGEMINYYPYILGTDTEYNYMYRISQRLYGYVDHHYTRLTP